MEEEEEEDREGIPQAAEAGAEDHMQQGPVVNASVQNVGTGSSIRLVNRATALPVPSAEQE